MSVEVGDKEDRSVEVCVISKREVYHWRWKEGGEARRGYHCMLKESACEEGGGGRGGRGEASVW